MSTERLTQLDDRALGAALHELDLAWPTPPDMVDSVLVAIKLGPVPRPRRSPRVRFVLVAAAAILALALAASAARLIIDLGAVRIEPIPSTSVSLPPSTVPIARLGEAVSLAEARAAVDFAVDVPPALGEPDRVWLVKGTTSFEPPEEGLIVALAWRPRLGLPRIAGTPYGATLLIFQGETDVAVKLIGAPIHQIAGQLAYWVSAPHELDLLVGGHVRTFRVTGNVVLWKDGPLVLRLETSLPRAVAIAIAFG